MVPVICSPFEMPKSSVKYHLVEREISRMCQSAITSLTLGHKNNIPIFYIWQLSITSGIN